MGALGLLITAVSVDTRKRTSDITSLDGPLWGAEVGF